MSDNVEKRFEPDVYIHVYNKEISFSNKIGESYETFYIPQNAVHVMIVCFWSK